MNLCRTLFDIICFCLKKLSPHEIWRNDSLTGFQTHFSTRSDLREAVNGRTRDLRKGAFDADQGALGAADGNEQDIAVREQFVRGFVGENFLERDGDFLPSVICLADKSSLVQASRLIRALG